MLEFYHNVELDMPLYEYICQSCQHKAMIYHKTFSQSSSRCPKCGNDALKRIFSTFSVGKTTKDLYDGILNDSQLVNGLMNNNPRALAEWSKRMNYGESVAPEYEEMVDRMERGELPDKPVGATATESTPEID